MRILIPKDVNFNFRECESLYNKNSLFLGNSCNFKDLVYNSHFFAFYDEEKLVGCVYVTKEEDKLFLNGFSIRKNHKFNIEAVKKIVSFYTCPIYAKTKHKTAEFLLKKCGFSLIKTDSDGIKYLKKEN